jgi:hypothetical protein
VTNRSSANKEQEVKPKRTAFFLLIDSSQEESSAGSNPELRKELKEGADLFDGVSYGS